MEVYRLLVGAGHTDFSRRFQLPPSQTLIPFKIMTFPVSGGDLGEGLLEKCLFLKFLIRGLGAFVAVRDCYNDSNASTLIKIGGILNIVFVI